MLSCSLSSDKARNRDSLKKKCNVHMYLFADMVVYNKKKIQMIFVEYGFYFTREVKNMYISFVASPLMKYKLFSTSLDEIKAIFNKTFEYPLYTANSRVENDIF